MVNDLVNNRIFRVNDVISTYTQEKVRIAAFELHGLNCVALLDSDIKSANSVIIYNIHSLISRERSDKDVKMDKTETTLFITADKKKLTSVSAIVYGVKLISPSQISYNSMMIERILERRSRTDKGKECLPGWLWFESKKDRDTYISKWQTDNAFMYDRVFSLQQLKEIIEKNPKRTRGTLYDELVLLRKNIGVKVPFIKKPK